MLNAECIVPDDERPILDRLTTDLSGDPVFRTPLKIVRPIFPEIDTILARFRDSLASGAVTNNGPWVVEFERQLQDYLGVPTLVFSSGQAALMTMLRAAGITSGEVIVPSFTFAATPQALNWVGAEPVFADIRDDLSFTIDPEDVERRITDRTTAILAVDPYGIACDYDALADIASRRKLKFVIDSAASFGTAVGKCLTGGFGDAQIFSFHATKAFNTMEGGCLCSNDSRLIARARAMRNFGQDESGNCVLAGLNGKMTEICAIIGLEQLKVFDRATMIRRRSAKRIQDGLRIIPEIQVARAPVGQEPIWLYLPVVIDMPAFGTDREAVAGRLLGQNLCVRKYYSPACHRMSVFRRDRVRPTLPVTERAAASVLALPIYNDMTDAECDGIVEAFVRVRGAS